MSDLAPETDDLEADIRAAFETADNESANSEPQEAGPARDEHGRFAPKTEAVDKPDDTPQIAAAETPAQADLQPEVTRPPHSLSAAVKAEWANLPKHVQEDFLKLEGTFQTSKTEWAPKGEVANKFEQLMQPHRDRLALNGLDPFGYLQALVHADEMLRTNPAQALPQIAQMYGIQLPGAPMDYQQQPQVSPELQAVQQQLSELRQSLEQERSAKQDGERQAVQGEIEAFRNDPKHLYFDNVRPLMSAFLKSEEASNLEEAYDMAIHAHPTIRALLQPTSKPQAGKPNGAQVNGSPGKASSSPTVNMESSIEDDIRAAMAGASGRV